MSETNGVIYDFGMNNGDDVVYYLKKAHKVVGVEANPTLVAQCAERFAAEIEARRLVLVGAALSTRDDDRPVSFYRHKTNHVLSRLDAPAQDCADEFEQINVPQIRASTVIARHGPPYYVKIDLEGFDAHVLRDIFGAELRPNFISVEAHTLAPFKLLVDAGYRAFNLVDGASVAHRYSNARIATLRGAEVYSFPTHSSGPFGEDIRTAWRNAEDFERLLAREGLGWKDIHATNAIAPQGRTAILRGRAFALAQDGRHFFKRAARTLARRLRG